MKREEILEYEIYAAGRFMKEGESYLKKWVDRLEVMNVERVHNAGKAPPYIYVCNHTSMLDYFIPSWVILNEGLPYPRSLVGSNLLNLFVKIFMWDFEKWGAIKVPRGKRVEENGEIKLIVEPREIKKYHRDNIEDLKNGNSLFVFPQGGRDSKERKERNHFKSEYFRIPLRALEKKEGGKFLIDDAQIVNVAAVYSVIPEKNYWKKIDAKGFGSKSYFFWDMFAYYRHTRSKEKGISTINFAEPVSLREIQGEGSLKQRANRVSDFCMRGIGGLLREIEQGSVEKVV